MSAGGMTPYRVVEVEVDLETKAVFARCVCCRETSSKTNGVTYDGATVVSTIRFIGGVDVTHVQPTRRGESSLFVPSIGIA